MSGVCVGAVVGVESVAVTEESLTGKHMVLLLLQQVCVLCAGGACTYVESCVGRVRVWRVICLGRPESDSESEV